MNVQLANVITDLSGVTGQAIVKAILGGTRFAQAGQVAGLPSEGK